MSKDTDLIDELSSLKKRFWQCSESVDFQALHYDCLNRSKNAQPSAVPYLFSHAARTLLHDVSLWVKSERGFYPSTELNRRVEALLEVPIFVNSRDNYYFEIVRGILHYINSRYSDAFIAFSAAARFADFYRIVKDDFGGGAAFAKALPNENTLQSLRILRDGKFRTYAANFKKHGPNILVAFDHLYAQAFCDKWLSWFDSSKGKVNLHFVVAFRADIEKAFLDDLLHSASEHHIDLSIHIETNVDLDRAYFACLRFMHLSKLLQACEGHFLVMDADLHPKGKVHHDLFSSDGSIVGAISHGPYLGYLPWRRFSAGFCHVPYNEIGFEFASSFSRTVSYFWDNRDERNWWIDQMCLEVTRILKSLPVRSGNREFWDAYEASETYKIQSLSKVPFVADQLSKGVSIEHAVREFNFAASRK